MDVHGGVLDATAASFKNDSVLPYGYRPFGRYDNMVDFLTLRVRSQRHARASGAPPDAARPHVPGRCGVPF